MATRALSPQPDTKLPEAVLEAARALGRMLAEEALERSRVPPQPARKLIQGR